MEPTASSRTPGPPPGLWLRLARAPARLLALDYDGTLAPLRAERDLARPISGVRESLRTIAALPETRVAVVSGRPVAELARLLFDGQPADAITLVGEHGWDCLAQGELVRVEPPSDARAAIRACADAATERGLGGLLERKRTALVLHTRGLDAERARRAESECAAAWSALSAGRGVRVDRIDGGVEVRCDGRDKGAMLRELIAACGRGALAVYVGDDVTDEDAFAALAGTGVGLRVGRPAGSTAAAGWFESGDDVAAWLGRWPTGLARAIRAAPR